jgi:hypothetical protein
MTSLVCPTSQKPNPPCRLCFNRLRLVSHAERVAEPFSPGGRLRHRLLGTGSAYLGTARRRLKRFRSGPEWTPHVPGCSRTLLRRRPRRALAHLRDNPRIVPTRFEDWLTQSTTPQTTVATQREILMHPTIVLVHGAFAESSSWDARQLLGEATLGRSRAATARPTCTSSRTASISSSAQTCPSNGPRGYRAENSAAYQFAQPPPRSDDHPAVPRPPLGARRAWRSSLGKQSQHARACHQDMRTKRVEAVNDVGAVACIHSQCRDDRAFRRGTYKGRLVPRRCRSHYGHLVRLVSAVRDQHGAGVGLACTGPSR